MHVVFVLITIYIAIFSITAFFVHLTESDPDINDNIVVILKLFLFFCVYIIIVLTIFLFKAFEKLQLNDE